VRDRLPGHGDLTSWRRQEPANEIPVPGVSSETRPRILEGFELETLCGKTDVASVREQLLAIRRDQMGHWMTLPTVPVKPEPAIHREDHPFSTVQEFPVRGRDVSGHAQCEAPSMESSTDRPAVLRTLPAPLQEQIRRKWRTRWDKPLGESPSLTNHPRRWCRRLSSRPWSCEG